MHWGYEYHINRNEIEADIFDGQFIGINRIAGGAQFDENQNQKKKCMIIMNYDV